MWWRLDIQHDIFQWKEMSACMSYINVHFFPKAGGWVSIVLFWVTSLHGNERTNLNNNVPCATCFSATINRKKWTMCGSKTCREKEDAWVGSYIVMFVELLRNSSPVIPPNTQGGSQCTYCSFYRDLYVIWKWGGNFFPSLLFLTLQKEIFVKGRWKESGMNALKEWGNENRL